MLRILSDSELYPRLFDWNGPLLRRTVVKWIRVNRLNPSEELIALWEKTGGGDFFETETILGPFADRCRADDVMSVNEFHWSRGMAKDLLVFHVGLGGVTAVTKGKGEVVVVNKNNHREAARYPSIDDWYTCSVRPEYAERYGLD